MLRLERARFPRCHAVSAHVKGDRAIENAGCQAEAAQGKACHGEAAASRTQPPNAEPNAQQCQRNAGQRQEKCRHETDHCERQTQRGAGSATLLLISNFAITHLLRFALWLIGIDGLQNGSATVAER